MKLYKLRPLTNFEFVLDIVLNERLYCAPFGSLNDPFEGVFMAVSHLPLMLFQSKGTVHHSRGTAADLYDWDKYSRVCSLSASFKDLRLWSHYADGHRGVAIELDFAGHEEDISPVEYLTELKKYSNTVLGQPFPEDILRKKTVHWQYEDECRVLQANDFYSVTGRVTSVLLGERVSETHRNILDKVLPEGIEMIETKINEATLEVEFKGSFQRQKRHQRGRLG